MTDHLIYLYYRYGLSIFDRSPFDCFARWGLKNEKSFFLFKTKDLI